VISLASPKGQKKKRARKKLPCDICGTVQANIWRHQRTMHNQVVQKRKRLTSKDGYVVYQCPIAECNKKCSRFRDHLIRSHNIKDPSQRRRLRTLALTFDQNTPSGIRERRSKKRKRIWPPEGQSSCMEISADPEIKTPDPNTGISRMLSDSSDDNDEENDDDKDEVDDDDKGEESQEEIEPTNEQNTKYFQLKILVDFIKYLQSGEHLKTPKSAVQHAKQVFAIWSGCPGARFILQNLVDSISYIIEDWIPNQLQKYKPGTIKSHISSLVLFMEFVCMQQLFPASALQVFVMRVKRASRALQKRCGQRQTQKDTEDINKMPSQQDICAFLRSSEVKDIETQIQTPHLLLADRRQYNLVMGYVILRILLANGQRAGAMLGITERVLKDVQFRREGAILQVRCLNITLYKLPVTCRRSVVHSGYSSFLHHYTTGDAVNDLNVLIGH